jgi:hypothetical protein
VVGGEQEKAVFDGGADHAKDASSAQGQVIRNPRDAITQHVGAVREPPHWHQVKKIE